MTLLILYIAVYLYQINKSAHLYKYSYKNFLLKKDVDFSRIIIESGSNSHHSIDSKMLENEFNKLVINISDNGSWPLRNKLYRLNQYVSKGDIILLPLEYSYYSYNKYTDIPKGYYNNILNSLHYYFTPLPFYEKINFILHSPFDLNLFINLFKTMKEIDLSKKFEIDFDNGLRGDHIFKTKGKMDSTKYKTCEEYIFFMNIPNNFKISKEFKENILLIKEIEKEKKVRFIFTYPTVVGQNCYNGKFKNDFYIMNIEIHKILDKNNIPLVGTFFDSNYEENYMDNTYYHVLPSGRALRTKKLIENINRSEYKKLFYSIESGVVK
jgi:hypothetical protein